MDVDREQVSKADRRFLDPLGMEIVETCSRALESESSQILSIVLSSIFAVYILVTLVVTVWQIFDASRSPLRSPSGEK